MVSTTNSPARWAAARPSAGDSPVFALAGIRKATFLHLIMKISMLHLGFILIAGAVAASAADELPAPKISDKNTAAVAPSAATSDKIMAALPLCGIGIGYVIGGRPLHLLVSGPLGWACLLGGVLLASAGVLWIDGLSRSVLESQAVQ